MKKKLIRIASIAILSVVTLGVSACVFSSDEEGKSNYLPLALNNYWVFENTATSETDTATVVGTTELDGNTYFVLDSFSALDFGTFRATSDGLMTNASGQGQAVASGFLGEGDDFGAISDLNIVVGETEWRLLKYPLASGNAWTIGTVDLTFTGADNSGIFDYVVDATLKGVSSLQETVTLPAGSLEDAIRIDLTVSVKTTRTPAGGGSSFTLTVVEDLGTAWFVDGVGLVKYQDDEETLELVSYTLN